MATSKKKSARNAAGKSAGRAGKSAPGMHVGWWGIALAVLALLALVGTGIVTVQWSDGRPTIAVKSGWVQEISSRVRQFGPPVAADSPTTTPVTSPVTSPDNSSDSTRSGDTIKIASFNIQVFGTSKLRKPDAMNVLTQVIRQFDVVAIQEVRSVDDNVLPTFVNMINADGRHYDFVIGPRLGRTNSKEQYATVFDTDRIEVDRANVYETADPQDLLHREPMVARFRVRGVPPDQAFTFSLVNIHTDPDETKTELNALADTFQSVQRDGSGEDDVILLGDLNVDEHHLGRLGSLANIAYAISGVTTNTRHNKTYDNIIFDRTTTTEYTQHSGVLDLMTTFQLTQEQALDVSDHFPVWAEFSVYESGVASSVAGRPTTTTR